MRTPPHDDGAIRRPWKWDEATSSIIIVHPWYESRRRLGAPARLGLELWRRWRLDVAPLVVTAFVGQGLVLVVPHRPGLVLLVMAGAAAAGIATVELVTRRR